MANILALQKLEAVAVEGTINQLGHSSGSSTCVGCSCTSDGCFTLAGV